MSYLEGNRPPTNIVSLNEEKESNDRTEGSVVEGVRMGVTTT